MGRYAFDKKSKTKISMPVWGIVFVASLTGGAYYWLGRDSDNEKSPAQAVDGQLSLELAIPAVDQPAPHNPSPNATTNADANVHTTAPQIAQAPTFDPGIITGSPTSDFVLPELKDSDEVFRADALKLSSNLSPWLQTGQLLARYLTLLNDFAQGQRPYRHAEFLRLDTRFAPQRNAHGFYLDASSYKRYDKFAAALDSVDPQGLVVLYKKYRPLLQQVFTGFSYPHNVHIEDIIQKAGANILQAPLIERPIGLLAHGSRYRFADPQLEGLDAVQKQMLRMGPENTRRVQEKVRQFLQALVS